MKKFLILTICFFVTAVAFPQDKGCFFHRLKEAFTVHDTVYIYADSLAHETDTIVTDTIPDDLDVPIEEEVEPEFSGNIPMPFDTLDTEDKFRKVILFDNNTWLYFNLDKPEIPDSLDTEYWNTEVIHVIGVDLKDIPETLDIPLVDSVHGYCIPHPGPIHSAFKYRGKHPHKGVDIALNVGDAIYAAFDGVVRVAMPTRMSGGYGNVVVIRHVNGLETYYAHLSKYVVKSGDVVRAGELIGYGGSTGRSSGPHLHFETRYMGQAFDPERIFDFQSGTLRDEIFTLKKHYFSCNSHYGQTDAQSYAASKKGPSSSNSSGSGNKVYYKVKSGDTLSKIAKRHGTTVAKICKLNGISQKKVLRVGERLRVK
jgi:murein DD-endopeptidase MepM/ murein hydrolase activator NlpD